MDKTDPLFLELVMSLQGAAMMQMGLIKDPMGRDTEVSLDMARHTIDMIAMLQSKMAGNLSADEGQMFDQVLHGLRMSFLEVSQKTPQEANAGRSAESDSSPDQATKNKAPKNADD